MSDRIKSYAIREAFTIGNVCRFERTDTEIVIRSNDRFFCMDKKYLEELIAKLTEQKELLKN